MFEVWRVILSINSFFSSTTDELHVMDEGTGIELAGIVAATVYDCLQ